MKYCNLDFALRDLLNQEMEMEESASHRLFTISCFAQVRAESCENDARDAPGKTKHQKFQLLSAPVDEHFRFGKMRCLSTLRFDTTHVKPATSTK